MPVSLVTMSPANRPFSPEAVGGLDELVRRVTAE
jgi:hypothetical protein